MEKADFERLLATRACARSAHFAIHHVLAPPLRLAERPPAAADRMLSTAPARICPQLVDESPQRIWLGCVVAKRLARRAVTRNLVRRQVRAAFVRHQARLQGGSWLVRLIAPYSRSEFVSASSPALARALRGELDTLLHRVAA